MSTASDQGYLGRTGLLSVEQNKFRIRVRVLDVARRYGRIDLWVEPRDGDGQVWVSADRVAFPDELEDCD